MKKIFSILLFICIFSLNAQNVYYPQVFFNKNEVESMLAHGNCTIDGVASTKQNNSYGFKPVFGKKYYAKSGTVIILFPVTPYLEEFYKMRKKYQKWDTNVYMSDEAFFYRYETITDSYGRFSFKNLKPGKYYLETIIDFTARAERKVETARTNTYNGYGQLLYSTPIYDTFFYNYSASNRESKFIEIKNDGEILKVNL